MTDLRNARHLSVHDLRRRINEGDVDTVVVAFTDVQGRLQGKRLQAVYFAEHVLDHGTEAPAYLLAVDVDMNIADRYGLALRGGHHCNQPLMRRFGLPGTTRASFYFYNTKEEIDRMIEILSDAVRFFS